MIPFSSDRHYSFMQGDFFSIHSETVQNLCLRETPKEGKMGLRMGR